MKSLVTLIFMSLILISVIAEKKPKPDKDRVKKQMGGDVVFTSGEELRTEACHDKNYCFFMGNKTDINTNDRFHPDRAKNHLKSSANEVNCTEEYCMRVNFKPVDASCSKFLVFMGVINKQVELQNRTKEHKVNQWIGIGFKKASNSMYSAYGMYCHENYPAALNYGQIVDKATVEFDERGVQFFTNNRGEQRPETDQGSTTAEDGMFYCSFTVPRYLEAISSEGEHIDIASGNFYILLASGIKWATANNLVKCDSDKPQDQCNPEQHRDWSDKHYIRGNTKEHVSKGGGWGICPPDPTGKGDASKLMNLGFFSSALLTFIVILFRR